MLISFPTSHLPRRGNSAGHRAKPQVHRSQPRTRAPELPAGHSPDDPTASSQNTLDKRRTIVGALVACREVFASDLPRSVSRASSCCSVLPGGGSRDRISAHLGEQDLVFGISIWERYLLPARGKSGQRPTDRNRQRHGGPALSGELELTWRHRRGSRACRLRCVERTLFWM